MVYIVDISSILTFVCFVLFIAAVICVLLYLSVGAHKRTLNEQYGINKSEGKSFWESIQNSPVGSPPFKHLEKEDEEIKEVPDRDALRCPICGSGGTTFQHSRVSNFKTLLIEETLFCEVCGHFEKTNTNIEEIVLNLMSEAVANDDSDDIQNVYDGFLNVPKLLNEYGLSILKSAMDQEDHVNLRDYVTKVVKDDIEGSFHITL